uniref:Uncharacterized protein n=1 Tax=Manihot esculenta TaxID=3983 RepID=A0A2C9VS48_MANES
MKYLSQKNKIKKKKFYSLVYHVLDVRQLYAAYILLIYLQLKSSQSS